MHNLNEYQLGYLAVGNVVACAVACMFYFLGGRAFKWRRRFIGSFVLALAVTVTSLILSVWSALLLAVYGFKAAEFSLGYSNDDSFGVIRRVLITALSLTCGAYLCWVFGGGWWLLIPHALMGSGTIMFAVKNPIPAASEEVLVCVMNSLVILFYPFVT